MGLFCLWSLSVFVLSYLAARLACRQKRLQSNSRLFVFCAYRIELFIDVAGIQSKCSEPVLLDLLDDLNHLMVLLGSHLTHLSEVNVVWDEGFVNTISQQPHNLVCIPKNKQTNKMRR